MPRAVIVLVLLVLLVPALPARADSMAQMPAVMPKLAYLPAVSDGGRFVYAFGGLTTNGDERSPQYSEKNQILRYDPSAQSLVAVGAMAFSRYGASAVWLNGSAYVWGGFHIFKNADSWETTYRPLMERWSPAGLQAGIVDVPQSQEWGATTTDAIHLDLRRLRRLVPRRDLARRSGRGLDRPRGAPAGSHDPRGRRVGRRALPPRRRRGPRGFVANVTAWDLATGAFEDRAPLPEPNYGNQVAWTGTDVVVLGGRNAWCDADTTIMRYRPATNQSSRSDASLDLPRSGSAAAWTGTSVAMLGGETDYYTQLGTILDFQADCAPAPQLSARAGPGRGEIRLSWSAPAAPMLGFSLVRADASTVELPAEAQGFDDLGLADGAARTYRIAVRTADGTGCLGAPVAASAFGKPSAPPSLSASGTVVDDRIHLSWDVPASNGGTPVTSYHHYRKARDNLTWRSLANVTAPATGYDDPTCGMDRVCTYGVAAVNLVGESPMAVTSIRGSALRPAVGGATGVYNDADADGQQGSEERILPLGAAIK